MSTKSTHPTTVSIYRPFLELENASEKSVCLSVKLPTAWLKANAGYNERSTYNARNEANPHAESCTTKFLCDCGKVRQNSPKKHSILTEPVLQVFKQCIQIFIYMMERSIRKWVLWISFYRKFR